MFALSLLFLFGCQSLERDNVYDPYGSNYIGGISSVAVPSSSSSVAAITGCGSTETQYCSDGVMKPYGKLTDSRDGKEYKTLVIGGQEWMAENLNYDGDTGSRYTVGKCIPSNGSVVSDSDCFYAKYGRLYDWVTAMGLSGEAYDYSKNIYGPTRCGADCYEPFVLPHRGICPQGWHLPTDAEWTTLVEAAGGASTAGSNLKAASGWKEDEYYGVKGTDVYGFSALPGGSGLSSGGFGSVGYNGYWWSSTEYNATIAYFWYMLYDDSEVVRYSYYKSNLYSVRCLRD